MEQRARFAFVEAALVVDAPHHQIVQGCREQFSMSEASVERAKSRVFKVWAAQDRESRAVHRQQARRRLVQIIRAAMRAQDWKAAVCAEGLLARIDGLIGAEHVRVQIDGAFARQQTAAEQVIREMSAEQVQASLRKYQSNVADAQKWRGLAKGTSANGTV